MDKYETCNIDTLVFGAAEVKNSRLWTTLFGSAIRRKLLDMIRCGVSRQLHEDNGSAIQVLPEFHPCGNRRSKRLSELLNDDRSPACQTPLKLVACENDKSHRLLDLLNLPEAAEILCNVSDSSTAICREVDASDLYIKNSVSVECVRNEQDKIGCDDLDSAKICCSDPDVTGEACSELDALESFWHESNATSEVRMETIEEIRGVIRQLQCEIMELKIEAARLARRLAKEDPAARVIFGMLGAIPVLIALLETKDIDLQIQALYALLNLAIGNNENKSAIVKAGAVHKMLNVIETNDRPSTILEATAANFLSLSALDTNRAIIGASGAIELLTSILQNSEGKFTKQCKEDCIRALLNLSNSPENIPFITETDVVQFFINILGDMQSSERILAILGNIISTAEGRMAVASAHEALPILIDVLNWTDSPGCQEKASYILMVMAHKMYWDRQEMVDAGITSASLELTLLGSTLAQKRASRILECLKMDKGKRICGAGHPVSAPLCHARCGLLDYSRESEMEIPNEAKMTNERWGVKQLVQQSLHTNMRRMMKRANLPQDFVLSVTLQKLTASSTSKSLPLLE